MRRIAVIGDIHGCIEELAELYGLIRGEGITEVYHVGDLVDRGPDSGAVVEFCRLNGIGGIRGNHDGVLLNWRQRDELPRNPDKKRSIEQIRSNDDWDYLASLPPLHVIDDLNVVLVHGGIRNAPLYAQTKEIMHMQMIHPSFPGKTKWFHKTLAGELEEDLVKQGWKRWYDAYDYPYDVIYGHSVNWTPLVKQNPGGGRTIGVDTGGCFGGRLTAVIYPDMKFISVQSKQYSGEMRFNRV